MYCCRRHRAINSMPGIGLLRFVISMPGYPIVRRLVTIWRRATA
jgi:hypothetical protein